MFKNNKFIVTGGNGFLGQHVVQNLIKLGIPKNHILIPTSKQYDLRLKKDVEKLLKKDTYVIHLAAKLDRLSDNVSKQADFFYDNSIMALNMLKVGNEIGIKKFVGIGSTLEYPEKISAPISENKIWDGYPAKITAPYGLAKRVMLVGSKYFYDQYKMNAIHLLITNLYGPGDNFKPLIARVIPSIILKIYEAQINKKNFINVWGDGSSSRDLLFIKDAAEAIILATKYYNKKEPLNIGSGKQTSIMEIVKQISILMNFNGKINWEKNRQDGQNINQFDIKMAKEEFGFEAKTELIFGLEQTIKYFILNNKYINI